MCLVLGLGLGIFIVIFSVILQKNLYIQYQENEK